MTTNPAAAGGGRFDLVDGLISLHTESQPIATHVTEIARPDPADIDYIARDDVDPASIPDPATIGPGRERSEAELESLAATAATELAGASADEVVAWAAQTFGNKLAVACSMANTVGPEFTARHLPGVDVLFLDTGYHFNETIEVRNTLAAKGTVTVKDVRARETVAQHEASMGSRPYVRDATECCNRRKVQPLNAALTGYEAWVTGVRRSDSAERADTPVVQWDATHKMVKVNPFASWTSEDINNWAESNGAEINPLRADGFLSIGCGPCTRRVRPGEDERAGRWAGTDKTECGIHL